MTDYTANEAKLASLYEQYYERIARYIYVHIGDRDEAQDLAGEVFLKALDSIKSYQERGFQMQSWLFRIAHNCVVDYLRKAARHNTRLVDAVIEAPGDDPSAVAERNHEMARVNQAMSKLTPEQRQVLSLRFLGCLTSREVAEVMKKSDGAVREMQRAAIQKLRSILVTEESYA